MRLKSKGCFITALILVLVGIVAVVVTVIASWRGGAWRAKLTAEAPAAVTGVRHEYQKLRRGSRNETMIFYRYEVGGRTFTREMTEPGDSRERYPPGERWKVCFNPSDPVDSLLVQPDYQCGQ